MHLIRTITSDLVNVSLMINFSLLKLFINLFKQKKILLTPNFWTCVCVYINFTLLFINL